MLALHPQDLPEGLSVWKAERRTATQKEGQEKKRGRR